MIVVFLGPPGSGKGTQADILAVRYGFYHFDTGARLRTEIASGSELGQTIASFTDNGNLVPIEVIRELVMTFMRNTDSRRIMFDGFPRNLEQARVLDEGLEELGGDLDFALYLEISEDSLIDRIVNRRFCPECGEIYNLGSRPPRQPGRCDIDGAGLYQRSDDTEEVFGNRLKVYLEQTVPVLEYYKARQRLYKIDGDQDIEQVAEAVAGLIGLECNDSA